MLVACQTGRVIDHTQSYRHDHLVIDISVWMQCIKPTYSMPFFQQSGHGLKNVSGVSSYACPSTLGLHASHSSSFILDGCCSGEDTQKDGGGHRAMSPSQMRLMPPSHDSKIAPAQRAAPGTRALDRFRQLGNLKLPLVNQVIWRLYFLSTSGAGLRRLVNA